MNIICDLKYCTGCSACMNVCPREAIIMTEKTPLGAIYPSINHEKCIDCKLCIKTCPVIHHVDLREPIKAYALTSKDIHDLETSTSGAASSALVTRLITTGGVAYGCVQNNYKSIHHLRVNSLQEALRLKKSKYVHSQIGYTFRQIKEDLLRGLNVIFIGTPCQIAGLRNFLKKDYENLYLIDLICHGVPPQKVLTEYVDYLLKKNELPLKDYFVEFRRYNKETHKIEYGLFLKDQDADVNLPDKDSLFLNCGFTSAFYACLTLRDNCYECPYAKSLRTGDITLGDFWGIKDSQINTDNGISLALVNTRKGEDLLAQILPEMNWEIHPVDEAVRGNGRLRSPATPIGNRDMFLRIYNKNPRKAYRKCCSTYIKHYEGHIAVYKKIYYKIKQLIKKLTR